MIDGLSSMNVFNVNIRKVNAEVDAATKNLHSDPLNMQNQRAFHDALAKRAYTTTAATNMINFLHNSRRTILNSF